MNLPSEMVLQQKQALVAELTAKLQGAKSGVVVDYSGISVADDTTLRRNLREAGVDYAVVKNTLLGRAADAVGMGDIKESLHGSTAVAISAEDELAPAKILCEYAAKHDHFVVKSGFMDGKIIDADTIKALSMVPPKETLYAMLAGGLNSIIGGLARALNAVAEKNGEPAPEAAAPAEA